MSREQLLSQLVPKTDQKQIFEVLERLQPALPKTSFRKKQGGGGQGLPIFHTISMCVSSVPGAKPI